MIDISRNTSTMHSFPPRLSVFAGGWHITRPRHLRDIMLGAIQSISLSFPRAACDGRSGVPSMERSSPKLSREVLVRLVKLAGQQPLH